MLPCLYLGTAYQTKQRSHYIRRVSPTKIDLFVLMKVNNVTSNVIRREQSETNKIARVITSVPYIVNIQIHTLGTN